MKINSVRKTMYLLTMQIILGGTWQYLAVNDESQKNSNDTSILNPI